MYIGPGTKLVKLFRLVSGLSYPTLLVVLITVSLTVVPVMILGAGQNRRDPRLGT